MLHCILELIFNLNLEDKVLIQIATTSDITQGEAVSFEDEIIKVTSDAGITVFLSLDQIVAVNLIANYDTSSPEKLLLDNLLRNIKKTCTPPCSSVCITDPIAKLLIRLKKFTTPDQLLNFASFGAQISRGAQDLSLSTNETSIYYSFVAGDNRSDEILTVLLNSAVSDVSLFEPPEEDVQEMFNSLH